MTLNVLKNVKLYLVDDQEYADIELPDGTTVNGIKIVHQNNFVLINLPSEFRGQWPYEVSLKEVRKGIINCYQDKETLQSQSQVTPQQPLKQTPVKTQIKSSSKERQKNKYGRMKNALTSSLRFIPHTVIRDEQFLTGAIIDQTNAFYRSKRSIEVALNRRDIGPFDISIVDWVSRLKYVTSTMIVDLIRGGYITLGWRESINHSKVSESIIPRLYKYKLVNISRFVTVDDEGVPEDGDAWRGHNRILSLGEMGNALLHELGRSDSRYSPFDIYQDGNTVKKYLVSNQWLIYWLVTFPDMIRDNYRTTDVAYLKEDEFNGARFYSIVNCFDISMIGEPVRRVEEFEVDNNSVWLQQKFVRFMTLFDHYHQLYFGQTPFSFDHRPILVYICEDDEHINETYNTLKSLIDDHPEQTVWFTTDLRIFNYDYAGQRLLRMDEGGIGIVDTEEALGIVDPLLKKKMEAK